MATYTPNGFNNAGATPGVILPKTTGVLPLSSINTSMNTSTPATIKQPAQTTQSSETGLNLNQFNQNLQAGLLSPSISKTKTPVNTNVTIAPQNTQTKTIQPEIPQGNTYNPSTGLYTSGNVGTAGAGKAGSNTSDQNQMAGQLEQNTIQNQNNIPTTFPGLLGGLSQAAQGQITNPAVQQGADQIAQLRAQAAQGEAANLTSGELSPIAQGRAGVINQSEAQMEQGIQQGIANQLAAQGQAISGLGTAAGLAQPVTQFGVLTNPVTGETISKGTPASLAAAGGAIQGAQSSAQDITQKVNTIQSQAPAAENNLKLALSIVNSAGINKDIPVVNAFANIYGSAFTQNPQYQSFLAQIGSVQKAYQDMGIDPGPIDWANVSVSQLENLAANLPKNIANQVDALNSQLQNLKTGGTQSSSAAPTDYNW